MTKPEREALTEMVDSLTETISVVYGLKGDGHDNAVNSLRRIQATLYNLLSDPVEQIREQKIMGKQILVDSDKFEHLLNCMAQLNFLPMSGMHADEPIIRKAYQEARDMLIKGINDPCAVPPSPCKEQP